MEYYIIDGELYSIDELQHHGIKGMKWGVRRTAEQLGHLVRAGRKKVATKKKEIDETRAKKKAAKAEEERKKSEEEAKAKAEAEAKRPKKVSEMTDAELKAAVDRLDLEKRYNDRMRELHPPQVSKGKAFIDSVTKDVLVPAAKEAGKNASRDIMNYLVGELEKEMGIKKTPTEKIIDLDNIGNTRKMSAEQAKALSTHISNVNSIDQYIDKRDHKDKKKK